MCFFLCISAVLSVNLSSAFQRINEICFMLKWLVIFVIRSVWLLQKVAFFSERELMIMFAICRRPSVCLSSVCLSVTFVHSTQPIEIFGNVFAPFNTLVTWWHPGKILRRLSQGNPSVGGLNQRVVEECSDFGPFRGYILETVQDRR